MGETSKQTLGKWGEEEASHFLINKNYEIVARNYSLPKKGEIDIVAWHIKNKNQKTLCFVEVKTRSHDDASAERSVGKKKMSALFVVAKDFCFKNNIDIDKTYIQFEQISIYKNKVGEDIKHYEIPM
ncbi:MAG: YraN family protein [Patescibacteria group bacterium]|nr:YraN family protein [Patescibacteria group bacterium]